MSQTSVDDCKPDIVTGLQYKVSPDFSLEALYLLVEDTVFCVNRKNFVDDSEFFKEMLDEPPEGAKPVEGTSVECPWRIEGVAKEELALFLRAMFPAYIGQDVDITGDQWITILKLSTTWRFVCGREAVVKKLHAIVTDPITQILLYQQHDLDAETWLVPAVNTLAQRKTSLSEEEGRRLGVESAIKIAAIREEFNCCCLITTGTGRAPSASLAVKPHTTRACPHRITNEFGVVIRRRFKVPSP